MPAFAGAGFEATCALSDTRRALRSETVVGDGQMRMECLTVDVHGGALLHADFEASVDD